MRSGVLCGRLPMPPVLPEIPLSGIDIDLDGIQNTLSNDAGRRIQPIQGAEISVFAAVDARPAYLHLVKGLPASDGRSDATSAKLLSYLVIDFVKKPEWTEENGCWSYNGNRPPII